MISLHVVYQASPVLLEICARSVSYKQAVAEPRQTQRAKCGILRGISRLRQLEAFVGVPQHPATCRVLWIWAAASEPINTSGRCIYVLQNVINSYTRIVYKSTLWAQTCCAKLCHRSGLCQTRMNFRLKKKEWSRKRIHEEKQ